MGKQGDHWETVAEPREAGSWVVPCVLEFGEMKGWVLGSDGINWGIEGDLGLAMLLAGRHQELCFGHVHVTLQCYSMDFGGLWGLEGSRAGHMFFVFSCPRS